MVTLSREQARRAYDRIGSLQDTQRFYEDPTTGMLLEHGRFQSAQSVFELGCGTGRFAKRLLDDYLPATARYRAIDLSPKMVALARQRLATYSPRAEVMLSDGGAPVAEPDGAYDRFVSNYVFDLLSHDDIRAMLTEAHRMLAPGGLLCLSGLSTGVGPGSRAMAGILGWIQSRAPMLIGGCRPLDLLPLLAGSAWRVQHHCKVTAFGVPTEAVVAQRV